MNIKQFVEVSNYDELIVGDTIILEDTRGIMHLLVIVRIADNFIIGKRSITNNDNFNTVEVFINIDNVYGKIFKLENEGEK